MFNNLPQNEQEVLLQYPNYNDDYIRQHYGELENLVSKNILTKKPNTSSWQPPAYIITDLGKSFLKRKK